MYYDVDVEMTIDCMLVAKQTTPAFQQNITSEKYTAQNSVAKRDVETEFIEPKHHI